MIKRMGLAFVVASLWFAVNVFAQQEGSLFETLRCGSCHKADVTRAAPSLQDMARAYQGKEKQLIQYLKGAAEPIVKPAKGNLMKRSLEKTKALSDVDRKALADFIMGQGAHGE